MSPKNIMLTCYCLFIVSELGVLKIREKVEKKVPQNEL